MGRGAPGNPSAWADRELLAPCFAVQVVGTTGSGDSTIAGFLAGMLTGQSPEQAVGSAVGVGACNVEAADATSGVPTWAAVQERIAAGWPRRRVDIPLPGWRVDRDTGLWRGSGDGPS